YFLLLRVLFYFLFFFFFQAEDGIRDRNVTGVQTCALPICGEHHLFVHVLSERYLHFLPELFLKLAGRYKEQLCQSLRSQGLMGRSEERRVGKECGGGDRARLET